MVLWNAEDVLFVRKVSSVNSDHLKNVKSAEIVKTPCLKIYRSGRGVQHYVIKFVSDLRQVGGFLLVLQFPPPIKLTATI
jgi:hypothetical protein